MLEEVVGTLTPDLIASNELGPRHHVRDLRAMLGAGRFTDDEVAAGQVLIVNVRLYWFNTASGVMRETRTLVLNADGLTVDPGNVVETAIGNAGPDRLVRVRSTSLGAGDCRYDARPAGVAKDVLGALSGVGASGKAGLYCNGIEHEGWTYSNVSSWVKLPGATATDDSSTVVTKTERLLEPASQKPYCPR